MKAIQIFNYSSDLQLEYVDIPKPTVQDDQVLIQGKFAGVDPHLILAMTGKAKLFDHYDFPLTLGNEVSGIVVAVGKKVINFKVGDSVYSMPPLDTMGAFAEYVAVQEQYVAMLPNNMSFQAGAAIPLSWLTIKQTFNILKPKQGEKIFIAGGTGGFGQIAVPYAKRIGLHVTVSGAKNDANLANELGADAFVNYEDSNDQNNYVDYFDYVIDTRGASEFNKQLKMLRKRGHLLSLNAGPNGRFSKRQIQSYSMRQKIIFRLIGLMFDVTAAMQKKQYDFLYVESDGSQLSEYADYFDENAVQPVIDTIYDFNQVDLAIDRMKLGNNQGKILLNLESRGE
ncbi:NADP-dependent oxidoreductase [Leuconostoc gasicomitatum]|uniref:NADP-dependent oxidoreductase n=1 Tax=Leuconostoc gasicomitatum TaxID=115778 RepID=A0A9Q3XTP1_9LACO|nr:NADP-dependent oxidoreductase [Leuconostoc gasicomitatum]MBZ5962910.1 NADP-dependent oxidoreductase [Leuconostoc gasicomitatum]